MKNTILTLAIMAMVVTLSNSYGQEPDKKSVKARENLKEERKDVVEAKKDLKEAQKDSVSDYQIFKKESEIQINDNEKRIAELKVKHSKMNKKESVIYQKRVSTLEQKNTALKTKLNNYKEAEGENMWVSFKREFNSDMADLKKELKGSFVSARK